VSQASGTGPEVAVARSGSRPPANPASAASAATDPIVAVSLVRMGTEDSIR
jgi:hypothetical protein